MEERLTLRVGDRLPIMSAGIRDEFGDPVVIGATDRAFMVMQSEDGGTVMGHASPWVVELPIVNRSTGQVVFDWLADDVEAARVGIYQLSVLITDASGDQKYVSPTQRVNNVSIRTGYEQLGYLLTESGGFLLQENGGYILL